MLLIALSLLGLVLDQITKFLALAELKDGRVISIIRNFLELEYVENYGAAFGILENKRVFFYLVSSLVIVFIAFFAYRNYHYLANTTRVALALLLAGSLGNLIDRVRLGYVIDFISVKFKEGYNFPVFNVADMFVVIGTGIIMLLIILEREDL